MKLVYVIRFHGKALLAHQPANLHQVTENNGLRPQIWTRRFDEAEKFESEPEAKLYARIHLPHKNFEILGVPVAYRPQGSGPRHA